MKKSILLILCAPMLAFPQNASEPQTGALLEVSVKPKLALRAGPSADKKIIGNLNFAEQVEFIEREKADTCILGVCGSWYKVRHKTKTGWAYGPFLRTQQAKHHYTVQDGLAIRIDPDLQISALLEKFQASVKKQTVKISFLGDQDSTMCFGDIFLTAKNNQIKSDSKGTAQVSCNAASPQEFTLKRWDIIGGQLILTGDLVWHAVCHSENCPPGSEGPSKPERRKVIIELRTSNADAEFVAKFLQ